MARRPPSARPAKTERVDVYREITDRSGADLALIERLAREADTRPVTIHRIDAFRDLYLSGGGAA